MTEQQVEHERELELKEALRMANHRAAQSNNRPDLPVDVSLGEPEVAVLRRFDAGDVARVGEVLLKKLVTRLFVAEDRLMILDGNHLTPCGPHVVRALISQSIVTPLLTER